MDGLVLPLAPFFTLPCGRAAHNLVLPILGNLGGLRPVGTKCGGYTFSYWSGVWCGVVVVCIAAAARRRCLESRAAACSFRLLASAVSAHDLPAVSAQPGTYLCQLP